MITKSWCEEKTGVPWYLLSWVILIGSISAFICLIPSTSTVLTISPSEKVMTDGTWEIVGLSYLKKEESIMVELKNTNQNPSFGTHSRSMILSKSHPDFVKFEAGGPPQYLLGGLIRFF